jgi:hypothetical protein
MLIVVRDDVDAVVAHCVSADELAALEDDGYRCAAGYLPG